MLSLSLDNLWSDQTLEADPDLPPGWRKIHDSSGTYYWHVPTGTTQWQRPYPDLPPGWRKIHDSSGTYYWHVPTGTTQWQRPPPPDPHPGLRSPRRDFAFVASEKDTCMLKCHVFHCNVPAKAIAKALHEMCSQPPSDGCWEGQGEPSPTARGLRRTLPLLSCPLEAGPEDAHIFECQVRYVTFIGVGRDAHAFALIVDLGQQHFQCAAFWCEPDAGTISEGVQAACMVQYQKCLVASTSRLKSKGGSRAGLKMKRTASVDSPGCPFPSLQKGGGGARKRGVFSFLDAFRQKQSVLQPLGGEALTQPGPQTLQPGLLLGVTMERERNGCWGAVTTPAPSSQTRM
nr:amyloid-beta A4 precursor protein-binding family B member 3 [Pelodiscus sinensis]|eukprot:XP_025044325.1 amyloid-beta A4 precursor protein-binding family B member 3 [Pelodiscus sinensis]